MILQSYVIVPFKFSSTRYLVTINRLDFASRIP